MTFREVTVYTSHEGVDAVSGALAMCEAEITELEISDGADFEEFLESNAPRWDYVDESLMELRGSEPYVRFYLPDNDQGREKLAQASEAIAELKMTDGTGLFGRLEIAIKDVREEDWENNWKAYFFPFPVGDKLYVKPSWIEEADPAEEGRGVIRIDPESAFGTGNHATTKLCMEALEDVVTDGCAVADLGTGSGILTISSLLLGALRVDAVDIDENAVNVARANLGRNGLGDRAAFFVGDVTRGGGPLAKLPAGSYDVVAANIVADVLCAMAESRVFSRLVKRGGALVVSGIIAGRLDDVKRAIAVDGFTEIVSIREQEDWYCLTLRKGVSA